MNKKNRNRFLALVCLLIFLALGGVFYVNWVVQRPFGVILFLSDNLTPSVLTPARNYQGGADHRLQIEKFPHLALLTTHANDFVVADATAAAFYAKSPDPLDYQNLARQLVEGADVSVLLGGGGWGPR